MLRCLLESAHLCTSSLQVSSTARALCSLIKFDFSQCGAGDRSGQAAIADRQKRSCRLMALWAWLAMLRLLYVCPARRCKTMRRWAPDAGASGPSPASTPKSSLGLPS
ncbi:unnamed protein product [Urochloa humidicola]